MDFLIYNLVFKIFGTSATSLFVVSLLSLYLNLATIPCFAISLVIGILAAVTPLDWSFTILKAMRELVDWF